MYKVLGITNNILCLGKSKSNEKEPQYVMKPHYSKHIARLLVLRYIEVALCQEFYLVVKKRQGGHSFAP